MLQLPERDVSGLPNEPLDENQERILARERSRRKAKFNHSSVEEDETAQNLELILRRCKEDTRNPDGTENPEKMARYFNVRKKRVYDRGHSSYYYLRKLSLFKKKAKDEAIRRNPVHPPPWEQVAHEWLPDKTERFQDAFAAHTAIHVSLDAPIGGKDSGGATYAERLEDPSSISEGFPIVERAVKNGELAEVHLHIAELMADAGPMSLSALIDGLEEVGWSKGRTWVHARRRELVACYNKEHGCRNDV